MSHQKLLFLGGLFGIQNQIWCKKLVVMVSVILARDCWMEADCCLCFRTRWLQLADRCSNRVGQSAAQNHSHMSLSSPAPTALHARLGPTRLTLLTGSNHAEVISTDDFRESEGLQLCVRQEMWTHSENKDTTHLTLLHNLIQSSTTVLPQTLNCAFSNKHVISNNVNINIIHSVLNWTTLHCTGVANKSINQSNLNHIVPFKHTRVTRDWKKKPGMKTGDECMPVSMNS